MRILDQNTWNHVCVSPSVWLKLPVEEKEEILRKTGNDKLGGLNTLSEVMNVLDYEAQQSLDQSQRPS